MWYEILPCTIVLYFSMALPAVGIMYLNLPIIGNKYRRNMDTKELRMQYLRDRRLIGTTSDTRSRRFFGNPYKLMGLEQTVFDWSEEDDEAEEEMKRCRELLEEKQKKK